MKNLFGIYYPDPHGGAPIDYARPFELRTLSQSLTDALFASYEEAGNMEKKRLLPFPLNLIFPISLLAFCITLPIILASRFVFSDTFQVASWVYEFCGGCGVLALLSFVYQKYLAKNAAADTDPDRQSTRQNAMLDKARRELKIPASAPSVDVLMYTYTVKKGKVKYLLPLCPFVNMETRLFVEGNNLCFGTDTAVLAVPLNSLRSLTMGKIAIRASGWNKSESVKSDKYKAHKLTLDNSGCVRMNRCCVMLFEHKGERYTVFFPPYEADVVSDITDLPLD